MNCTLHQILFGYRIEKNEMVGARNTYGGKGEVFKCLVEKHEVNRPIKKPRHRREDDFKTDLQEMK